MMKLYEIVLKDSEKGDVDRGHKLLRHHDAGHITLILHPFCGRSKPNTQRTIMSQ